MRFNNFKVLTKQVPYSSENLFVDTQDSISDVIVAEYIRITGDNTASVETELSSVDDEIIDALIKFINVTFDLNYDLNQDGRPETIGDLVVFVKLHKQQTVTNIQWDSSEFHKVSARLETTLRMLDTIANSEHSEEGLGTGLLKIFIGVADLFIRVGNTFKTNVFKFFKNLKRSEIRYYTESHLLKVKAVEDVDYTKVMKLDIPVPTGMISNYIDATNYVTKVYESVGISDYANSLYKELVDIRRQMTRNESRYKQGFSKTAKLVLAKLDMVRNIVSEQTKYFSDKQVPVKAQFSIAFGSMTNLKETRVKLIDMEQYLATTQSLVTLVDNIDAILGDITGYLSEDNEVDRQFVSELADTVRFLATGFDIYGQTAIRQMALEHNLILCYELLYKHI